MSVGAVLANARRRAGLSVTWVSHRTRIKETIITGIEGDDYSACGGDFYARGHIRAIAAAAGADPEPLIELYDAARLGPQALAGEATEPLTPLRVPQRPRPGPAAPAGMHQERPPAGPVTPAGRRRRQRRPPAWALGAVLVAGLGCAGYLIAATGHAAAPSAAAHPATPRRAGQASHAVSAAGGVQAAPAPAATAPAAAPPRTLAPARAAAFGSSGGAGDNSDLASRAIDGNPATAWHTDWYATARFGNLYPGTGLLADMGRTVTITAAAVITLGRARGARVQLRAGGAPALASLRPVTRAAGAGGVIRLRLTRPARGRYVPLWFTSLPPGRSGTFQATVYGLHLQGR